ncbi:MAG: thioesterase family protein [Firmicutes bacterium]|nr:thioesterase family protein [Bacillota bacterium]
MHRIQLRVRFGETDMAGHVNNAVYLSYLEEARIRFLEEVLGVTELPFILASAKLDFLRQVFFRDALTVTTGVIRLGRTSLHLVHQLRRNADDALALQSETVLVHFNYATQKPEPLPSSWRPLLMAHITEVPKVRTS